jgi:insertion element IS1 protein InsB
VFPPEKLVMSSARTDDIEQNHCRQKHWFGRFKRKSMIIARVKDLVDLTMASFARFGGNGCISERFTLAMIT